MNNKQTLVVIDEISEQIEQITKPFSNNYVVLHATGFEEAYDYLAHYDNGVFITDMIVSGESIAPIYRNVWSIFKLARQRATVTR